jgi:ribonuclease Z
MYSMPHRLENCQSITLPNPARWTLQGHSKAGERTGFWIEQLKIVLDAGLSTYKSPKAIFLTHSHTDHSIEISCIYEGREKAILKGKGKKVDSEKGRPVIMQYYCIPLIRKLLDSRTDLSTGIADYCEKTGEDPWFRRASYPFIVEKNKTYRMNEIPNIEIEIMDGFHSSPSVGYGFSTITHKLKPELLELTNVKTATGREKFIKLKKEYEKNGICITYERITPQFIYYGDTNITALTEHHQWKKYSVVIIECTLFGDKHKISKRQYQEHIHWNNIIEIIRQHKDIHFILIHTSMSVDSDFLIDLEKKEKIANNTYNFQFFGY